MASFGSIVDCGSKPGGFSRLTYDVMQWIRKIKVGKNVYYSIKEKKEKLNYSRLTLGSIRWRWNYIK